MKPNWKDAPKWAQWLAQSRYGVWHWYENEPVLRKDERFPTQGTMMDAGIDAEIGEDVSWRSTKEQRPVTTTTKDVLTELDELIAGKCGGELYAEANQLREIRTKVAALIEACGPMDKFPHRTTPDAHVVELKPTAYELRMFCNALRDIVR